MVRDFEYDSGQNIYKVHAETFSSCNEAMMVTRMRPAPKGWRMDIDFCAEKWICQCPYSNWDGFSSKEEFDELMRYGVQDTSVIPKVARYAAKADVEDRDKLTQRGYDVVGGCVNVPRFLTGNPKCMYTLKRRPTTSKIINIGVLCGVTCGHSPEEYQEAGMAVTKVIAKLEKAGYRVSLTTMGAFADLYNNDVWLITTSVKRENMPMNYSRIMFPLTSVAYFRGLCFGWVVRTGYRGKSSLGTTLDYIFNEGDDRTEELFIRASGLNQNTKCFTIKELISICHKRGGEAAEKYIEGEIRKLEW